MPYLEPVQPRHELRGPVGGRVHDAEAEDGEPADADEVEDGAAEEEGKVRADGADVDEVGGEELEPQDEEDAEGVGDQVGDVGGSQRARGSLELQR